MIWGYTHFRKPPSYVYTVMARNTSYKY
jgi:hypothetical protein